MTLARLAAFAAGALLSTGCMTTERPSLSRTDAMGHPAQPTASGFRWTTEGGSLDAPAAPRAPLPSPPPTRWQWNLEAGPSAQPVEAGAQTLAGGLRVAVADAAPTGGRTETFAVEEGVPTAVTVGWARWSADDYPATDAAGGRPGEARVEWLVALERSGNCDVALEAVPRIGGLTDCPVLLEEYRIRRTLSLGQAVVLSTEGEERSSRVAMALVGAREGKPARFVLRVR